MAQNALDKVAILSSLTGQENEIFLTRDELTKRWKCSPKAVLRAEKRLGLHPYRMFRAVRYALSNIVEIENQGLSRLPQGDSSHLRPYQRAELRRLEQEDAAQ